MIKKLNIKNFQSHKNTQLKLHPGVNVIIGETDSGKSAVIRALRWLTDNKPNGDSFRSSWGGKTSVSIQTKENDIISRQRDTENLYYLNDHKFAAFSTGVPEDVLSTLNLTEVNAQYQLDSPFLLSSTAGQVAQFFNKIAHLDKIDQGQKNLRKWTGQLNRKIESLTEDIKESKEQLKDYAYLKPLAKQIEAVEKKQEQMESMRTKKQSIEDTLYSLSSLETRLKEYQNKVSLDVLVTKTLKLYKDLKTTKQSKEVLKTLVERHATITQQLQDYQHTTKLSKMVDVATGLITLRDKKDEEYLQLDVIITRIESNVAYLEENNKALTKVEKEFNDNFPEICPLCGESHNKH